MSESKSHSAMHQRPSGFAEVGTFVFEGRPYTNLGATRRGDRLFAYVRLVKGPPADRADMTAWEGQILGTAVLGPRYRCPTFGGFGSTRRSVTATIDGETWYGTYYESSGDYCRLKRAKRPRK